MRHQQALPILVSALRDPDDRIAGLAGGRLSQIFDIRGSSFSEGLAVVKVGGLFGYIDRQGSFAIPPAYAYASRFSEVSPSSA
jgi:hypothetical protein